MKTLDKLFMKEQCGILFRKDNILFVKIVPNISQNVHKFEYSKFDLFASIFLGNISGYKYIGIFHTHKNGGSASKTDLNNLRGYNLIYSHKYDNFTLYNIINGAISTRVRIPANRIKFF